MPIDPWPAFEEWLRRARPDTQPTRMQKEWLQAKLRGENPPLEGWPKATGKSWVLSVWNDYVEYLLQDAEIY